MCDVKKLDKDLINKYANTFSVGFEGYSLFEHFFKDYKIKDVVTFFKVALKADKNLMGLNTLDYSAVSVYSKKGNKDASILDFIKAGGLFYFFKFGFKATMKMINFSNFAGSIKRKYIKENDIYLYLIAAIPEARHHGLGKKLITPMLELCDKENRNCYLETLDLENTLIYERFGFKLMEVNDLPKSDLKLYCMLRKPNEIQ